ncbi:MAG: chemotaxis response regulator protein-glutamate methylesterase [Mariprofundaceae bacterium]|nr:chemotaxis response regulator protein-glutamate methylesterase [Mariprofundaceae bacterium]
MSRIRVLIVDDSALARKILSSGLSGDPDIEIIGTARDPLAAQKILAKTRPDVIVLDIEMPRMDGVTFLRQYMPVDPIPTVVVSALTERDKKITLEALEAGAVDVVLKPKIGVVDRLPLLMTDIRERIKAAAQVKISPRALNSYQKATPPMEIDEPAVVSTEKIIAIGASAGGVKALTSIIPAFPAAAPGIVVTQHMPAGFTSTFASRLNNLAAMQVKEAEHGDRVRPGLVLLAPGGDRHMEVHRSGSEYRVALVAGEKVSGHRPSVDVLFYSMARYVGRNAAAALLTGMGADGARGLKAIREAGGRTFAQDETTSVVFGMPREAWKIGAAEKLVPLERIPAELLAALKYGQPRRKKSVD